MNVETPSVRVLANVSVIVLGVMVASYGEIAFNLTGFVFQTAGIFFEAFRLILVQRLLWSAEYRMDPLVSLYYFAPVCALMNFLIFLVFEASKLGMSEILKLGLLTLLANAALAFVLNISVVFLVISIFKPQSCRFLLTVYLRSAEPPRWSLPCAVCSKISS